LKIGIDIDGVLTDIEQFELDYGSKYYIENTNKKLKNPFGYGSQKIFKGSYKEDTKFWEKAIYQYIKEPTRKFANEVIKKMKNEGNEIYIITARTSDLSYCDITKEQMEQIVKIWLKENDIYYDKIIFTNESKLKYCLDNNITIMIEDKPKNVKELSTVMPVICFDARYNQKCKGRNIIRCYSWYDIYDKIKNLI